MVLERMSTTMGSSEPSEEDINTTKVEPLVISWSFGENGIQHNGRFYLKLYDLEGSLKVHQDAFHPKEVEQNLSESLFS